jgi:hypothetical protein
LSGNTASQYGGGLYLTGLLPSDAERPVAAALHNNLFWANLASAASDFWIENAAASNAETAVVELFNNNFDQQPAQGHHFDLVFPIPANNLDRLDPRFTDPGNHDLHVEADSPMINAGHNDAPALGATDIDDEPRIQGPAIDIGADEVNLLDLAPTTPLPEIYANNARTSLVIAAGTRLVIDVALNAGALAGSAADWWAAAKSSDGWWHSYQYPSADWIGVGKSETALLPAYQGPLGNLPQFPIFDASDLPPGHYVLYFGFDLDMNGVLDLSQAYYDAVEITVE